MYRNMQLTVAVSWTLQHRRWILLVLVVLLTCLSYGLFGNFDASLHVYDGVPNRHIVRQRWDEYMKYCTQNGANTVNDPPGFETRAQTPVRENDSGYFDCYNMTPLRFLPDFKSPCWNGTVDNGPINDNNTHCLPYFYIIGMSKCGTTDLYERVRRHPDIVNPGFKEPRWLGRIRQNPPKTGGLDRRSLSYYVRLYNRATTRVMQHTKHDNNGSKYCHRVFGDGSPSTLSQNKGWWRLSGNKHATEPRYTNLHCIHRLVPGAKIIVIFRDPVTRAYSNYLYRFTKTANIKDRPSKYEFHAHVVNATHEFHTCLRKRSLRACVYNGSWTDESQFKVRLDIGLYAFYMSEVYTVFRRENVHTVLLPEYHDHMSDVLKNIHKFLGLRTLGQPEMLSVLQMSVQNDNVVIRQRTEPMLNETRQLLRQFYAPYNEAMAKLMGDSRYLFSN